MGQFHPVEIIWNQAPSGAAWPAAATMTASFLALSRRLINRGYQCVAAYRVAIEVGRIPVLTDAVAIGVSAPLASITYCETVLLAQFVT